MLVTAGLDAADRLHIGAGTAGPCCTCGLPDNDRIAASSWQAPMWGDAWARPSAAAPLEASPLHLAGRADPGHRPVYTHWAEVEDAVHFQHRTTERNGVRVRDARPSTVRPRR